MGKASSEGFTEPSAADDAGVEVSRGEEKATLVSSLLWSSLSVVLEPSSAKSPCELFLAMSLDSGITAFLMFGRFASWRGITGTTLLLLDDLLGALLELFDLAGPFA